MSENDVSTRFTGLEARLDRLERLLAMLSDRLDRSAGTTADVKTGIQHAKDHIRGNSVHPGPIDTDMIRDTLSEPALREERLNRIPLRRIGRPEDVAYGVLYLASDESSFVTGSELVIDGGTTAQ